MDSRGDVWIGTDGAGLGVCATGRSRSTARDGLASDTVETIQEDRDGNLWIGCRSGGISRLADGKFSSFTPADGLSDDTVLLDLRGPRGAACGSARSPAASIA